MCEATKLKDVDLNSIRDERNRIMDDQAVIMDARHKIIVMSAWLLKMYQDGLIDGKEYDRQIDNLARILEGLQLGKKYTDRASKWPDLMV